VAESALERDLAEQILKAGLPEPQRELRFAPPRMYRFDFAWLDRKIAVEAEGGTWSFGRHTRGSGFEADCDKYNLAVSQGWRVYRFTGTHIKNGTALQLIQRALRKEN
jgi:very-short-patch-repair endonuclease